MFSLNNAQNIDFVLVYRDGFFMGDVPATLLSYQDDGVSSIYTYDYQLKSVDNNGQISPWSTNLVATP